MSDADTSAYLLMAAGVFWLLVGIVGGSRSVKSRDEAPEQHVVEEREAPDERRATELSSASARRWDHHDDHPAES